MYADPALFRSAVPPFRCRYDSDHEPAEFYGPPALTHFALIFNSLNHIRRGSAAVPPPPPLQPTGGSAPQLHCSITETVSTCPHRWRKLLLLLLFNCQYSSDYSYLTQEPRLVFAPNSTILLKTKKWLFYLQIQTGVPQTVSPTERSEYTWIILPNDLVQDISERNIYSHVWILFDEFKVFSIPRLYVKVLITYIFKNKDTMFSFIDHNHFTRSIANSSIT